MTPDFRRLWAAQAVSDFGARITREGLPIMAVTVLAATPSQLGLLSALGSAAALAVGVCAGGFVDHTQRRRILIGADLVRAAILVTIPLAAVLHLLTIWQVYAAAGLVAAASVLFAIADHAYLPGLVPRDQLTAANTRISATESVAEVGGPALAGLLFQWLTAPFAVALNALTYLASAVFLARIQAPEPAHPDAKVRRPWSDGVRTGAATAWAHPIVRPTLIMTGAYTVFSSFFGALYIVFALRELHLTPALLGIAIASGGGGAFLGTLLVKPLSRRLGVGGAIIAGLAFSQVSVLLVPLAPPNTAGGLAVLIAGQVIGDAAGVVAIVLSVSLRQSLIPQHLLGRVGATFHATAGGMSVVGALVGGALGQAIGIRETLFVAAAGMTVGPVIGLLSPLGRVRSMPEAPA